MRVGPFGKNSISVIDGAIDVFVKTMGALETGVEKAKTERLKILDDISQLEVRNEDISKAQDRAQRILTKLQQIVE